MRSTACRGSAATLGAANVGPSRPVAPWIDRATRSGRVDGASEPAAIGMPRIPATEQTRRALSVVFSSVWLPATVVIATSSIAGEAAASRMAMASSWPGSQSRMIGRRSAITP
jgi:hypothetical protein